MSPFLVYLMMQSDSIGSSFGMLALITGILSVFLYAGYVLSGLDCDTGEIHELLKRPVRLVVVAFVFSFMVSALIPSTKTIALMVVLPKVTSPQALDAMGSEAKEIYGLAKDALKNMAKEEQEEQKEQSK